MFWGVTLLSGRRYTQTVEKSYHISKAALEVPLDNKGPSKRVQLMLEQNKTHYLLCNLDNDKYIQQDLDLVFSEGEEVTFYLNGDGVVHLSGYVLAFDDDFDEEDFDEEAISDEESEEEEVTNENAKRLIKNADTAGQKKIKVEPKAVNGVDDDDDDEDDEEGDILGNLDEEFESDEEEDEEDDEEDDEEEEDEAPKKPVQKQVNGQAPKAQQQQQKGTPGKQQQAQQNVKNSGNAAKPNQTPKGGQANQNKFGQKGQQTPQGQKPNNQNQKVGQQQQQQKGQPNQQNKQQFNNKQKGSFTPDQKSAKKTLAGGLQVDDVVTGSGPEARKGKMVHVRYVGKLPNNKVFDKSDKPFSFRLGTGSVIKGWDQGVEGMKVGGKRKLVIPPNMGYGNRAMGPIPGNSTLHFEVELVAVTGSK